MSIVVTQAKGCFLLSNQKMECNQKERGGERVTEKESERERETLEVKWKCRVETCG